jgi:hypothetical protein
MRIRWDRIDKIKKALGNIGIKVGSTIKNISASLKTYSDKAPQRRKEEIKRLKDEIMIRKLKKQKENLSGGCF